MQEAYITSEELFNNIKEDFYSYDNANLIDEGKFYKYVTYIIGLLGIAWYKPEDEMLDIVRYSSKLPNDFYLLDAAYACDLERENNIQPKGVLLTQRNFNHYSDECNTEPCADCHVPTKCVFNEYEQILVQRNNIVNTYSKPRLLRIGNSKTRSMCQSDCFNLGSNSSDTITIQNGKLFTNFETGSVYITYSAFPLDESTGLPLVPNNERVIKCIEYYIKSKLLENMWVNGDADVAQKIQYFDAKYKEALGDAMYETKLPTFNTMVNQVHLMKKRLNVFQFNQNRRY